MPQTKLLLVVPCYNEEEILAKTHRTLQQYRARLVQEGKIVAESKIC